MVTRRVPLPMALTGRIVCLLDADCRLTGILRVSQSREHVLCFRTRCVFALKRRVWVAKPLLNLFVHDPPRIFLGNIRGREWGGL